MKKRDVLTTRIPIFDRTPLQSPYVEKYREKSKKRMGTGVVVVEPYRTAAEPLIEHSDLLLITDGRVPYIDNLRESLFQWVFHNKHTCSLSILLYRITPFVKSWEIIWLLQGLNCRLSKVFLEYARTTNQEEKWCKLEQVVVVGEEYRCSDDFQMRFTQSISDFLVSYSPGVEIVIL